MDDVVTRFARELADAVAAAVAESPEVEACRARARAAGYEMKLTLEAVVGFAQRSSGEAGGEQAVEVPSSRALVSRRVAEMTVNDRRFLRSLRISADEAAGAKTE